MANWDGCSEKIVREEILKARASPRKTISNKEKVLKRDDRVTFNIKYYHPIFKNIKNVLEDSDILIAPDEQLKKVFAGISTIDFKKGKSLKDHLVRSCLPKLEVASNFGPWSGKSPPCKSCKLMKETSTFRKQNFGEI